jgi:hypothetical protein
MLRKVSIVSGLLLAMAASGAAAQDRRPPQTDETVAVTRGARLLLNNFAGEIAIRTWDRDQVRVQARHASRTRVNIRPVPSGLSIRASASMGPEGAVDYEITAPGWMPIKVDGHYNFVTVEGAQSEVAIETVRGDIVVKGGSGFVSAKSVEGEVIVEGARGRVSAHSVNEGIRITATSGDIVAETINGSVSLSKIESGNVEVGTVNGNITYDGSAAAGGKYRFTTHNGNIGVSVPETANATFNVRTYNGEFSSNLPVTKSGDGDVRRGRRVSYTLGNGSAEFELESFGGAIRLRKPGTLPAPRSKEKEKGEA